MTAGGVPLLVVEDEPALRRLLRIGLEAQGFRVSEARTAREALAAAARDAPDAMLLDLSLPDGDGLDVIRRLRGAGSRLPIVVLSARGDERTKVEALEIGADDYVTKPFGMPELVARLRTALRHGLQERGSAAVVTAGPIRIDLTRRLVTVDDRPVALSNKEWDILRALAVEAGRVLTHRRLMEQVWGPQVDVQYLRIYMRQIRQKLEADPTCPAHLLTETGIGYRLKADD